MDVADKHAFNDCFSCIQGNFSRCAWQTWWAEFTG